MHLGSGREEGKKSKMTTYLDGKEDDASQKKWKN